MSQTDPATTTPTDICTAALEECGVVGLGQTLAPYDLAKAKSRLQWMMQQWQVQRFTVFCLLTSVVNTTGSVSYTVGPGGDFNIVGERPSRIVSAVFRQNNGNIPVDTPLTMLPALEDYNALSIKSLQGIPKAAFYEPSWPTGGLFIWPRASDGNQIMISYNAPLPTNFIAADAPFLLPYEYYNAMVLNLALALRPVFRIPTFPGDPLVQMASAAMSVLRTANFASLMLKMPGALRKKSRVGAALYDGGTS